MAPRSILKPSNNVTYDSADDDPSEDELRDSETLARNTKLNARIRFAPTSARMQTASTRVARGHRNEMLPRAASPKPREKVRTLIQRSGEASRRCVVSDADASVGQRLKDATKYALYGIKDAAEVADSLPILLR